MQMKIQETLGKQRKYYRIAVFVRARLPKIAELVCFHVTCGDVIKDFNKKIRAKLNTQIAKVRKIKFGADEIRRQRFRNGLGRE